MTYNVYKIKKKQYRVLVGRVVDDVDITTYAAAYSVFTEKSSVVYAVLSLY